MMTKQEFTSFMKKEAKQQRVNANPKAITMVEFMKLNPKDRINLVLQKKVAVKG